MGKTKNHPPEKQKIIYFPPNPRPSTHVYIKDRELGKTITPPTSDGNIVMKDFNPEIHIAQLYNSQRELFNRKRTIANHERASVFNPQTDVQIRRGYQ